jgi:hypothetical protein
MEVRKDLYPIAIYNSGPNFTDSDDFLMKQGWILTRTEMDCYHAFCTLAVPADIHDIQTVYEKVFAIDYKRPVRRHSLPWLGRIAKAATDHIPIIILSSYPKSRDPIFLNVEKHVILRSEIDLKEPCTLSLDFSSVQLIMSWETTKEYFDWFTAFTLAVELSQDAGISHSMSAL